MPTSVTKIADLTPAEIASVQTLSLEVHPSVKTQNWAGRAIVSLAVPAENRTTVD